MRKFKKSIIKPFINAIKVVKVFLFYIIIFSNILFGQSNCPLNTPEFPFTTDDNWNTYGWSANLYHPNQMGGAQVLTSISFRIDNTGGGSQTYTSCKIWVRHTLTTNYASNPGYPGTTGFTEVYSGNFTFNGSGIYTFNFNVTPSFSYDGTSFFEVLFENRGGVYNWQEPWFDRTDGTAAGIYPGKVGWGTSWANAKTISSNRQFNLQINGVGCGNYPLPVKLTSSKLNCEDNFVILKWTTSSEINNDYFTIESSVDGKKWKEEVQLKGSGNSENINSYSVKINKNKFYPANYYRLSQTDFDGKHKNLVTHSSNCNAKLDSDVRISPNPFIDKIEIKCNKAINDKILLYNLLGKRIDARILRLTNNNYEINTTNLPKGIYFVALNKQYLKVIKQ